MDQHHSHGWHRSRLVGWVGLGLVAAVVFGFAFGFFVMWLWNWLMPALFGLKAVTYWQAVGLVVLAHLFFGSAAHGHSGHRGHHGHHPGSCHPFHHHRHGEFAHYGEWWKTEGRQAFETYVERVNADKKPTDES